MAAEKKEVKITIMADPKLAEWISAAAAKLNRNKSEVIRASVLIGLPAVLDMPGLAYKLDFADRESNQIITR